MKKKPKLKDLEAVWDKVMEKPPIRDYQNLKPGEIVEGQQNMKWVYDSHGWSAYYYRPLHPSIFHIASLSWMIKFYICKTFGHRSPICTPTYDAEHWFCPRCFAPAKLVVGKKK